MGTVLKKDLKNLNQDYISLSVEEKMFSTGFVPPKPKETVSITTKEATVQANVERNTFSLPDRTSELRAAVEQISKPLVDVNLKASIQIKGTDSEDVVQSVEATNLFFRQMVSEIENLSSRSEDGKVESVETVRHNMAAKFQNDVTNMLEKDDRFQLVRQNSSAFVQSFSRAESLLEQGSKGYVDAVRKLLIHEDESVTVVMKDLSYSVTKKRDLERSSSSSGIATVGTVLCDLIVSPFRCIVRASKGYHQIQPEEKYLLKNITTTLKSGRMTLVLAPPGSSKSLFLKAVSGLLNRAPGEAKLTGTLQYNGYDVDKLKNLDSWASYVHQTDEHQALLTTRETLEFAWKCRREPMFNAYAQNDKTIALKQVEIDVMLATLGLKTCENTYIGNSTLKGVSGGEKRRVTLGEKLVTGSQIFALDEISTGLDAAATFDIVAHLSSVAHLLGQTIVIALLQPPPEVIALFDDIICLAEGQVIYNGERVKVLEYFSNLGYTIPERMELGDFLQTIPTPNGKRYFQKAGASPLRSPSEFAQAWRNSKQYKDIEAEVNELVGKEGVSLDNKPLLGFFASLLLVTKITLRLRLRQTAQLAAKLFSNVVMGAFFGSLFWQLGFEESFLKAMLLFQIPSFVFSTAFPNVEVLSKQKPVIIKQIDASFYSASVFTFSQFMVSIPFILFDVGCFGNIVYWSTGLSSDRDTFLVFLALMLIFAIAMNSTFSVFPFLAAKEDASIMLAVLFLLSCFLNSGMIATPDIVPVYLTPFFWADPLAWVLRALSINEYHSGGAYDNLPCHIDILGHKLTVQEKCGDYFLEMRQIKTEDYWIPYTFIFLGGFSLFAIFWNIYAAGRVRFEEERSERKVVEEKSSPVDDVEVGEIDGFRPPLLMRQDSIDVPRQLMIIRDLWYTVRIEKEDIDFLKGVSFWATPGRMIALMGSSGAGKTTLMDVIAGRKTTGSWRGEILVDGKPKVQSEFIRYAAYVEQFGVHSPAATVMESLQFSAQLRLPLYFSEERKRNFIEEQLEILELVDLKDALCSTLSMEQNKRLTLGVELVANPSIVFADEPTSSLDARAAAIVMRVLSKIARSGRTVICTIHQPSTEVFLGFDDLLLLKRGGEIAYFGELGLNAKSLINYLESVPGTTRCQANANPSTWMLEVIGAGTTGAGQSLDSEGKRVDFAAIYKRSTLKAANDAELNRLIQTQGQYESSSPPTRGFVRGYFYQFLMLLTRNFQAYWRTVSFTLGRFGVVGAITLLFALIFWQQPLEDIAGVQSRIILIFFYTGILSMYNLYTIIPFAMARLPVFYRERATGMYSITAHVLADSVVEIPFVFLEILLGVGGLYLAVGMNPSFDRFLFAFLLIFLCVYLLTMVGLLFSALLPDPLSAQLSAVSFVQILQIFSGILVPEQDLPNPYKPLYYISPFMWNAEGTITTQFHGDDTKMCAPLGKIPTSPLLLKLKLCTKDGSNDFSKVSGLITTVEEFALKEFLPDFDFNNRFKDIGVLVLWIILVRLFTIFVVTFVNHNKR